MRLNVVTLCSGYDSQCLALERLKSRFADVFDYELLAWAEIDRYTIEAHDVLFPEWKGNNMGDITCCDWSSVGGDVDLLVYSTPCTSISSAGKQEGLKEGSGTASSIIWSVLRAIDTLHPKYLLMENVKALISNKFIGDFREWQNELSRRGYTNFVKVLDAQDYGVPQHRERVFMVSILDENASFHFPEPIQLERKLKDVLESNVDEKYYLSEKMIKCVFSNGGKDNKFKGGIGICNREDEKIPTLTAQYYKTGRQSAYIREKVNVVGNLYKGNCQADRIYDSEGVSPTLDVCSGGNRMPKIAVELGQQEKSIPEDEPISILGVTANPCRREFNGGKLNIEICHTLAAEEAKNTSIVWERFRIRKLTPKEVFRLMDVDDTDIDKLLASGISNSQLYKMAGNSIVVNVLYHIFRKMFIEKENESNQLTLF